MFVQLTVYFAILETSNCLYYRYAVTQHFASPAFFLYHKDPVPFNLFRPDFSKPPPYFLQLASPSSGKVRGHLLAVGRSAFTAGRWIFLRSELVWIGGRGGYGARIFRSRWSIFPVSQELCLHVIFLHQCAFFRNGLHERKRNSIAKRYLINS